MQVDAGEHSKEGFVKILGGLLVGFSTPLLRVPVIGPLVCIHWSCQEAEGAGGGHHDVS